MTHKKVIIIAVCTGIIVSLCLVIPIASVRYLSTNPSAAELEDEVIGRMTLTEEEAEWYSEMLVIGVITNFLIHLSLVSCPTIIIGTLLGLIGAFIWNRRFPKEGIDL